MGFKYTKIPDDAFQKLVMNAGIICKDFDPSTKEASNQIGATTGGLQIDCTPTYEDFGEDIDNCPKNVLELKRITSYEVKASGTLLTVDKNGAKMLLGAADISGDKITPRMDLKVADFADIWIIADYSDENTGANAGYIACHILNALNTSGFSLKTADKGKGQISFELTGHVSMSAQDVVPFEVYIKGSGSALIPSIEISSKYVEVAKASASSNHTVVVRAVTIPENATVTWTSAASGTASVTASTDTKSCTITGVDTGTTIVTASITEDDVTYTDTCTVVVTAS